MTTTETVRHTGGCARPAVPGTSTSSDARCQELSLRQLEAVTGGKGGNSNRGGYRSRLLARFMDNRSIHFVSA